MLPCLRADIEPHSVDIDGQELIALRDPQGFASDTAVVPPGTLHILQYFDGTHTLEEIRDDLARRGAGIVGLDDLGTIVDNLDRCYLLDNEHFAAARMARTREFLDAPVRAAVHAGAAYPDAPDEARTFLQEMLDEVGPAEPKELRRLIAPHIDLRLGSDIHAHAHRSLRAAGRPDVVVVLGVCHAASRSRFILCRKDFETPLGTVPHDAGLADRIEQRVGDLTAEQLVHRDEHSVEFQAAWLAHHWPDDPPAMLPILVGSFHDLVDAGRSPAEDADVEEFIAALADAIREDGRRIVTVASVDFSHVGPMYGHENGLDERGEEELAALDGRVIEKITAGDPEGFFEELARDGNARNVCGLAPVYVTLRLGEGEGELLKYGQGRIHPESGSVVSYAALAFPN